MTDINLAITGTEETGLWTLINGSFPVLLGAAIAFGTTWIFALRAERDRKLDLGHALFFRARDATESVLALRNAITSNLTPEAIGNVEYRWQLVQIPVGFIWEQSLVFEPGELGLLAQAGDFEAVNNLGQIARGHNILHIIAGEYARRREALTDQIRRRSKSTVSGTEVGSWMTKDDLEALAPDMMLVDDLLGQLLSKADDIANFSIPVMEALGPKIRSALNDKRFRGRVTYPTKNAANEDASA